VGVLELVLFISGFSRIGLSGIFHFIGIFITICYKNMVVVKLKKPGKKYSKKVEYL